MNKKHVLLLGGGGHAKVVLDSLLQDSYVTVRGILDKNADLAGTTVLGIPVLGAEESILSHYLSADVHLVNGIGSITVSPQRAAIFKAWQQAGYRFHTVIHPTAYLGKEVNLGEGSQCLAGSIVQTGTTIGANVIVNTKASIDHDCEIGDHVHLAPGVICCGQVKIGHGTHVGSGAIILQGIEIGNHCLIAAGAVVTKPVFSGARVAGVPAELMGAYI